MASEIITTRLRELHGSGYEVATGQPDIRGWDVRDESGRKFGKVSELIFDISALKVRYMVVNILDVKELELEKRTILVPIGLAELDATDNDVILPKVTAFQLRALPRYDKHNLGAKTEYDISQVFGREHTLAEASSTEVNQSFYDHEHFDDNNLYNRRNSSLSSESLREEMRLRLELEKAKEREREQASLLRDAELEERVSFNRPEDARKLGGQNTDATHDKYMPHKNPDRNI